MKEFCYRLTTPSAHFKPTTYLEAARVKRMLLEARTIELQFLTGHDSGHREMVCTMS